MDYQELTKYYVKEKGGWIPDYIKNFVVNELSGFPFYFIGHHPEYGWFATATQDSGPLLWSEKPIPNDTEPELHERQNRFNRYNALIESEQSPPPLCTQEPGTNP